MPKKSSLYRTFSLLSLLFVMLFGSITTVAASEDEDLQNDSLHAQLYRKFLNAYNQKGHEKAFYKIANEMCDFYRQKNMPSHYYKMQLNICLYDTENDHSDLAMQRANKMLQDMEEEGFDAYSMVYMALGTVFENRGNYHMAQHYFEQALSNLPSDDKGSRMAIYSRMAYLLMFRDPVDAKYWNDRYEEESITFPEYRQVYLFLDCMIMFALNDEFHFRKSYAEYMKYHSDNQERLDNYGMETLRLANMAMDKNYDEALTQLHHSRTGDLNQITTYDMRITILKMKEDYKEALRVTEQRAVTVDSLNSDMLFANLNEMSAQVGVSRTESKAAHDRLVMLIIVIVLAAAVIGILFYFVMYNRKVTTELKEKNKQLASTLAMAEESQKMKLEFVRSVSHEIRTPLNAINGFNDILNTPGLDLPEEERKDLLERIKENVEAITKIVDEMLRVADKESNEYADQSEQFYCNQFFSSLLYAYRNQVSGAVELKYTTKVINRVQFKSNEEGLRKIMDNLIQNAIKFTKEGFIRVHCEQSTDGKRLIVSVADSGKGISKDMQDKIFEGFVKEDSFQQGIGLGLTLSKQIAKKLGGDLTIDKEYIGGARFVLTLPMVD